MPKAKAKEVITVTVSINGSVIAARTAVNVTRGEINDDTECLYEVDCGNLIAHRHGDGALVLAKKMLDLVKEVRAKKEGK